MQEELERLRAENAHLRSLLRSRGDLQGSGNVADRTTRTTSQYPTARCDASTADAGASPPGWEPGPHDHTREQIARYSRQLILPSFGVQGAFCCTPHSIIPSSLLTAAEAETCHHAP